MEILFIVLFGACLGSFLNVCIYRLPLSKSIIKPRSFCIYCKQKIFWHDNIPLLSYLFLKGRCRHCSRKIPIRYFLVELITILLLVTIYIFFDSWVLFFCYTLFASGLIIATFTDIKHKIIPDEVNLGLLVLGILVSFIFPELHRVKSHFLSLGHSLLGALVGGGSIFLIGALGKLVFKKESMGGGDVKFFAMAGSFLGWKLILLAFFIAPFFGSIFGILMRFIYKEEYIPYGPFLSIGCLIALFWGYEILNWLLIGTY